MSTFAEVQSLILPSQPAQVVNLADNAAHLTVAEAQALIGTGVRFADDDVITILDSAINLEGLGASGIGELAGMGASWLVPPTVRWISALRRSTRSPPMA